MYGEEVEISQGGSLLRNYGNTDSQHHHHPPSNLANHFPSAASPPPNPDLINHEINHETLQGHQGHDPMTSDPAMVNMTYEPAVTYDPMTSGDNVMTRSTTSNGSGRGATMVGTMKRGKKGREVVEVQVELTERELKTLKRTSKVMDRKQDTCKCGLSKGFHILLFTLLFIPLAFLATLCVVFYVGTMCWYNIYLYLAEEKSIWHKIFLCPLLLLSYPFLIVFIVLGIALYACVVQVSWYYYSWYKEIRDFDKGFFGWLCNKLNVPQCAPYEVVIIDDVPANGEPQQGSQNAVSNV